MKKKKSESKEVSYKAISTVLDVSLLNPAAFNPPIRTEGRALAKLKESIEHDGVLKEIDVIHIPPKYIYTIADGHRRHEISRQLGLKTIRVRLYSEGTPEELWAKLNNNRKINAAEWMWSWMMSNGDVIPSSSILREIETCVELFGSKEEMRKYLMDGKRMISPGICNQILGVCWLLENNKNKLGTIPTRTDVSRWMAVKNQQYESRKFVEIARHSDAKKGLKLARKLRNAIKRNQEVFTYTKSKSLDS